MKVLHTADWHIGQLFHDYDRTYEHSQFLDWSHVLLFQKQFNSTTRKSLSFPFGLDLILLSYNVMKVELPFLYECFDSFDSNTLNIAMDAMERLQNHGRKVGVISHVQEMTERIPVQIKVSKVGSGRSKVDTIGS